MIEQAVLYCYTRMYPNLLARSTQRNEGMHPILKAVLNPQMPLEQSVRAMQAELKRWYREIREAENRSRVDRPRSIDFQAFSEWFGFMTIWAIEKVNPEWVATKQLAEIVRQEGMRDWVCNCEIWVGLLLPCRHTMLRACLEGMPLPRSLAHPRWWIDGPPTPYEWSPRYYDATLPPDDIVPTRYQDPGTNKFLAATSDIQELHKTIPRQQRDLLANQLSTFHVNVAASHGKLQEIAQGIPTELPKPPPTRREAWEQKLVQKQHGKTSRRLLTQREVAERDTRREERGFIPINSIVETVSLVDNPPASTAPPALSTKSAKILPPPLPPKPKGRPRGSKNSIPPAAVPALLEPPPSSAPPVLTRSGRAVTKATKWEPAPIRRARGETLEAEAATLKPVRKKSRVELAEGETMVNPIDVEERESQQQRIIRSGFINVDDDD